MKTKRIKSLSDLTINHDYYCSSNNYYSKDCTYEYITWSDFFDENEDVDLDYNLVFRWDIFPPEERDDNKDAHFMEIFIMQQRRGRFVVYLIDEIYESDFEQIKEYLAPRWEKMKNIWKPFN